MEENNNVTNDEVKAEKVSNVENNEVKTDVVNVDASVLTNEEIKNISEDVITTPQENVELPELPKIEPEVVTPNNTSKPVIENKPKKKKHPIKIIINIFMWIVVLGWAGMLIYDFISTLSGKNPTFCLENTTEKVTDGTIETCEGVGYKVYKYNYGGQGYIEFVPFFQKPKTYEEVKEINKW